MTYLFPDAALRTCSSIELRALIADRMDDALDQPDGADPNADVRIDYAQDLIQQACDILLGRDESFAAEEKRNMSFVRWPPSPEQKAAAERHHQAEEAAEGDRRRAWSAHEVELRAAAMARIQGAPPSGAADEADVTISINGCDHIPGPEIMRMVADMAAILGKEPFLSYCCSRPGVTIAADPSPIGFGIHFPFTAPDAAWRLVQDWLRTGKAWSVELFDQRPCAPMNFHTSIRDLLPTPCREAPEPIATNAPTDALADDCFLFDRPVDGATLPTDRPATILSLAVGAGLAAAALTLLAALRLL